MVGSIDLNLLIIVGGMILFGILTLATMLIMDARDRRDKNEL